MEAFHAREGERAACLTFCRDVVTRLAADAGADTLHKAQVETLMADRVSEQFWGRREGETHLDF